MASSAVEERGNLVKRDEPPEWVHGGGERLALRVLAPAGAALPPAVCAMYQVAPGGEVTLHVHQERTELWVVVAGTGTVQCGAALAAVAAGTVLHTPPGVPHALRNTSAEPLLFVNVAVPAPRRDPVTGRRLDSHDLSPPAAG